MWWERLGVAPVRPEDAQKGWHKADFVLRELSQVEKAVKAAGTAKAVGWWLGPWQPATKGHQAVITVYFEKKVHAQTFGDKPVAGVKRAEAERPLERDRPAPKPITKPVKVKPALAKLATKPAAKAAKKPLAKPPKAVAKKSRSR